jgi:F-type H+-transporting ATPase subunit gamma
LLADSFLRDDRLRATTAVVAMAALTPWSFNPLLRPHHQSNRILIVVFTGDKGLAGGFHNGIADKAIEFGSSLKNKKVSYYLFGKKGIHRFSQKNIKAFKQFQSLVTGLSFKDAQAVARELIEYYTAEKFDLIYLFYAKFYSAMSQKPRPFQLLPIDPSQSKHKEESGLFIFEPQRRELLGSIVPRYVESEIFRAFLETEAGELGARMTAMSTATDNADEIIAEYQLEYNRLRQAKITKEITEIIGGSDALQKNSK